ncbi:hypothetical protein Hanom_Chr03g00229411 [Helianthus anomalus]
MAEEESVQVEEGPFPVHKWDQGLFEQITRDFQFPPEWDAHYPRQGQTAADAPPGYITLFEDVFLQGNFQLPATESMASILHFYGFHISRMSPAGMVRVRQFEFLCRSQGMEPTVEKFRAFYHLIRNIGFYSFGNRGAFKKILIGPPKSFHDWKMKFFFIREEVMPIAMIFHDSDKIDKEELPIPKGADWYMNLLAMPNRIFGEQVLVAAQMSDKWPETSEEVPVLKFNDEEPYWYEHIKGNFLYPPAGVFANPPSTTEGVQLPKPRPLRGMTSAGKEILFLSSEESTSKKVTVDTGATSKKGESSRASAATHDKGTLRFRQSNLEDYVVASDSLEGLSRIGEKKKSSAAASKSFGSAWSRAPKSGATPSSIPVDEEEEEAAKLITKKRSREETAAGSKPAQKVVGTALKRAPEKFKDTGGEKPKEPAAKKTKFIIKPPRTSEKEAGTETAATTRHDEAQGLEVVYITELNQPFKEKEPEVLKPKEPEVATHGDTSVAAGGAGAGGSGEGGQKGEGNKWVMPQTPIGPKDTLGDIYYKTYTEEARGDAPHQHVWGLK